MPQFDPPPSYPPQNSPAAGNPQAPRFLEQVANACRAKHFAYRTEQVYVAWVKRFILCHDKRHPKDMGEQECFGQRFPLVQRCRDSLFSSKEKECPEAKDPRGAKDSIASGAIGRLDIKTGDTASMRYVARLPTTSYRAVRIHASGVGNPAIRSQVADSILTCSSDSTVLLNRLRLRSMQRAAGT